MFVPTMIGWGAIADGALAVWAGFNTDDAGTVPRNAATI